MIFDLELLMSGFAKLMAVWTYPDVMLLRALAEKKLTAAEIAKQMQRSEIAIRRAAAKFHVELPSMRADWKPDEVETLRRLVSDGLPTSLIVKQLGRSENSVKRKALELGLALKAPGQKRFG